MTSNLIRLTNLSWGVMFVLAGWLSVAQAGAATAVRIELIDAPFLSDSAAVSVVLREAATGTPIPGKPVWVKLTQAGHSPDWQAVLTDSHGMAHAVLARLKDNQGRLLDSSKFIAEFNIRRDDGGGNQQLDPEYGYFHFDQQIPASGGTPPVAIISQPMQNGLPVSETCLQRDVAVRFESLSYAGDSLEQTPNYHIDDWYWKITDPDGRTTLGNGSAIDFRPAVFGAYRVQLVVWDHNGRIGATSVSFSVLLIEVPWRLHGWGACPHGHTRSATPVVRDDGLGVSDAFGDLVAECTLGGFRIRWLTSDGMVRTIGQCVYRAGENFGFAIYDTCKHRYTKFVWRNEEGHDRTNPRRPVDDSFPKGSPNGLYDADFYSFYPETNELKVEHCTKRMSRNRIEVGPWRCVEYDHRTLASAANPADADNRLGAIWLQGMRSDWQNDGDGNAPVGARALVYGLAPAGNVRVNLPGRSLLIPILAGASPTQVAQAIASAVNQDSILSAMEITATLPESPDPDLASVLLEHVVEEDLSFAVEAAGSRSFGLVQGLDWPEVSTRVQGEGLVLSWPQSPHPFLLESSSVLSEMGWRPLTHGVIQDTNAGIVSAALPVQGAAGFFRLHLQP